MTSIIAVVSLVQGINAYVSDAILRPVGVDTFTVQRFADDRAATRSSRRCAATRASRCDDATPCARYSELVKAVVMSQASSSGAIRYKDE